MKKTMDSSKRTTRATIKETGTALVEGLPLAPVPKAVKKEQRRYDLTPEEANTLKNFYKAFIHKYQQTHHEEFTTPEEEQVLIENYLLEIYKATRTEYNIQKKTSFKDKIKKNVLEKLTQTYTEPGEKRWMEICIDLIHDELANSTPLMAYYRTIYRELRTRFLRNYDITNILPGDALIRNKIYKNLTYEEFLTATDKASISQLTNEEKRDLLMLLNDPTSKVFADLLMYIQKGSYALARDLISLQADLYGEQGDVVDTMKFNMNTTKYSGYPNVILQAIIYDTNNTNEMRSFIEYILDQPDLNLTHYFKGTYKTPYLNTKEVLHTPLSYTLLRASIGDERLWHVAKKILEKKPMTELYIDETVIPVKKVGKTSQKICSRAYGVLTYVDGKQECIDNVWIFRNLPRDKVLWLVEHGKLDMRSGHKGRDKFLNVRTALHLHSEEIAYDKLKLVEEMENYQQLVAAINDKITKAIQLQEHLKKQREPLTTLVTNWRGEIEKKQQEIDKLQRTLETFAPMFDNYEIQLHHGGRKPPGQKKGRRSKY